MNDFSNPDELLLRAIRPPSIRPRFWNPDGSLKAAAFIKKNGCSVDRCGDREIDESVKDMQKRLTGQIVGVTVGICKEKDVLIASCPSKDNPYHCELRGSPDKCVLEYEQADWLAEHAVPVDGSSTIMMWS